MAVTRVKLGHSTLREKLGALLFLACILAGSVIGAGVVGPMQYRAQMDALDLSPGSVGSAADHSAPEVSTLAEMQANERFILVNEEFGDWQRSTGEMVGDTYYNKITLTDGTIAGSVTDLMGCMKTAVSFGIPLEDAVRAAAVNPAKAIGIYSRCGSLEPGKRANLVILDQNLEIKDVFFRGEPVAVEE